MNYKSTLGKTAAVLLAVSAFSFAQEAPQAPPRPPNSPVAPLAPLPPLDHGRQRDDYRRGQSALDRRDYRQAIEAFQRVVAEKGNRTDGALYWRAYAENRLGMRSEALATLAELKKDYPSSRWLEEGQALEVEVRQASGRPISPENAGDEDTKILILSGMIDSDPDRTVPILEKVLKGNNSPKVKERALFVLAQSRSPKSRDLIGQIAKGRSNPDLQAKAVEYLGLFGGRESAQTLGEVYKSTADMQVKRSILRSFMISGNKEAVLAAAKTDSNPELRVEAIHLLGTMGGSGDLLQLYTPDAPVEVKKAVLQGLFIGGNADKILEIARTDKDMTMRRAAVRQLGMMGREKVGDSLVSIYAKESDPSIKREVLNALFIQQNSHSLIEIAKKESDPGLKQEAVRKLSMMHTKETTDYLMELLNK